MIILEEQVASIIEELEQAVTQYNNKLARANSLIGRVKSGSSIYHKLQNIIALYNNLALAASSRVITLKALIESGSFDQAKTYILMDIKLKN